MKNETLNLMKKNKYYYILLVCLFLFTLILIGVLNGNINNFDTIIYNTIISLKSNVMTLAFKIITKFGNAEVLILFTIICLIFIKNRKIGINIALNLASIGFINYILKEIIQRPRPPLELRMIEENSFSFPSGHTMASTAFYGLIIYFILNKVNNKIIKRYLSIILSVLIFLIGMSRIYLGVHYASDVLAGYIFSIMYLVMYIKIIKNESIK